MKHHSEELHAAARPAEPLAAAAFDAMERARIEALGARHMDGMRGNLAARRAMRMRSDPISRAQNRAEVPMSSALELIPRAALTGSRQPPGPEPGPSLAAEGLDRGWSGPSAAAASRHPEPGGYAAPATL